MSYSKYPSQLDGSLELPPTTDDVTPVKAEVVNRLRDAILAIESELGVDPSREFGTVRARLDNMSDLINDLYGTTPVPTPDPTPTPGEAQNNILSTAYSCNSSIAVNDVVYISSSNTVGLADNNGSNTFPVIGIVTSKPTTTTCIICLFGEITLSGLTAGVSYYLSSTAGAMTVTPPTASGSIIQILGVAKTSTIFSLNINLNYIEN